MFLNKTKFKKMMKEAFNNQGLIIGAVYGGIILSSGYWVTWTNAGSVPNWLKGYIVELAGEMPEAEEIFKAQKNELLQHEIKNNAFYDLPNRFRDSHHVFIDTHISVEGWRLLQNKTSSNIIIAAEHMFEVVDLSELGGENPPMGPVSCNGDGGFLIYKNEYSAYAFTKGGTSDKSTLEVMKCLENIDFGKEGQ